LAAQIGGQPALADAVDEGRRPPAARVPGRDDRQSRRLPGLEAAVEGGGTIRDV
jgi:hypothetical protein